MTAQHQGKSMETRHRFRVTHENGKTYDVIVWTDEKGKFADDEISFRDEPLDNEGEEGEIVEAIMTYLDENWDKLVRA